MKNILFATDLSEDSQKAFAYAIQFAKQYQAEISLVNIYQMPSIYKYPYSEYTEKQEEIDMAAVEEKMDKMYDAYEAECGIKSTVSYKLVKEPSVVRGILQSIKNDNPNILMLSTKGNNMGQEIVFGKIVKRLVRECPIPVMTIPPDAIFRDMSKVLFTTNYYKGDLMALKEFIHLFNPVQPKINIIHVSTKPDVNKYLEGESFLESVNKVVDYGPISHKILSSTKVIGGLKEYIIINQPNLLVMTYKKHGVWYDLFHVDKIKKMELHSSTPVMTYNEISLGRLAENNISVVTDERE